MGLHLAPGAMSPSNCSSRSVVLSTSCCNHVEVDSVRLAPRHVSEQTIYIYSFGYRYAFHKVRSSGLPGLPVSRSLF